MFDFPCPQCGVKQPAVEAHVGRQRSCLYCGGEFTVPTESEAKALLAKPATADRERQRRKRREKTRPPKRPAFDPGRQERPTALSPGGTETQPDGVGGTRAGEAGARQVVGPTTPSSASPFRPSVVGLVAANVSLLAGVVFLGWDVGIVVFLFWVENVIVSVLAGWTVLRAVLARIRLPVPFLVNPVMHIFFTCFHGLFVMFLIMPGIPGIPGGAEAVMTEEGQPGLRIPVAMQILILGVCISHLVAYLANAKARREDRFAATLQMVVRSEARVVVMHLTIIFGMFAVMILQHNAAVLVVFILLKTCFDYLLQSVRVRKAHVDPYEYVSVDSKKFSWLDLELFNDVRAELEGQGCLFMGDYENLTMLRKKPRTRTVIRRMLSKGGAIRVACRQLGQGSRKRLLGFSGTTPSSVSRTIELVTEFNDGTFLCSTNSKAPVKPDEIPCARVIRCPQSTPLLDMLEVHRSTIALWTREDPGYQPVCFADIEQVRESDHRLRELQNTYKLRSGEYFVGADQ